ncbi:unnamed protein product [Discula destructiva]
MADSNMVAEANTTEDTALIATVARPPSTLYYFAYGSNLSSTQMRARCPGSRGVALGVLRGWDFRINTRGFANVVPSFAATTAAAAASRSSPPHVYGVLYKLESAEEKAALDMYEGVPVAYEDVVLPVEMVQDCGDGNEVVVGVVWALVYVDRWRTETGQPRAEYVGRMNRGLEEAECEWGLPKSYVKAMVRRFIPAQQEYS